MDTSWIEQYKKTEEKYKPFYKTSITRITLIFYYINSKNELHKVKKEKYNVTENKITRDELLYKIKSNSIDNHIKYQFHSMFKYNETSKDSEDISRKTSIIKDVVKVDHIEFEDTIKQFQDLNTINIFFKEKEKTRKKWSKTMKIRKKNKHNRTHHRY